MGEVSYGWRHELFAKDKRNPSGVAYACKPCAMYYQAQWAGREYKPLLVRNFTDICALEGCGKPRYKKDRGYSAYCSTHMNYFDTYSDHSLETVIRHQVKIIYNQGKRKKRSRRQQLYANATITEEEALELFYEQDQKCGICLEPFTYIETLDQTQLPSIDRLHYDAGYHKHECRITHAICNRALNNYPWNTFLRMCRNVAKNHPEPNIIHLPDRTKYGGQFPILEVI